MDDGNPIKNVLNRFLRSKPQKEGSSEEKVEEEIIQMVSEGHEQGVIDAQEAEMIHNIMEFDDKMADDVMTHRKNIMALDVDTPIQEAAVEMVNQPYSRYPVYEKDIDNIVGVIHIRDVLQVLLEGKDNLKVKDIMNKPYFVPETQNISHLFREMKNKKVHLAIVIDEYGQTAGVLSLEDILEEIVGNILDEYDVKEQVIQDLGNQVYLIQGLAELDEIEKALGIEFEGDFDTLNGFMTDKLEHIPIEGEDASIEYKGYFFKVMDVDDNVIQTVKVYRSVHLDEE